MRANEEFTAWLRGERTMPFGPNNQHTTVRLIDFDDLTRNHCVVTTQFTFRASHAITRRPDLVLLVNGIPLVIGECKTPVRPAVSWVDGAAQIQDDYEANIPALFVPNVFSFATEGKTYRFGAIRMPLEIWAPWRDDSPLLAGEGLGGEVQAAVRGMLRPDLVLDILQYFTVFATDKKHRRSKLICRYQ